MLTAKIRQKLPVVPAKAPKRQPVVQKTAPTKSRKPVAMPIKPVVLKSRQAKQETISVQPAPRPVKPKPKMITTMPIPQTQPVIETLPPPPPAALESVAPHPPTPVQVLPDHKPMDVMPKVDSEPVVLGSYFSIQILRGESYRDVANAVLTASDSLGVLFRKLQVMDIMAVGTTAFVRFRSDITELDKVLQALPTRGRVAADATGAYVVTFQDGRRGKYPTSTMNSSAKLGFGQTFAGPRIKNWRRQF